MMTRERSSGHEQGPDGRPPLRNRGTDPRQGRGPSGRLGSGISPDPVRGVSELTPMADGFNVQPG